MKIEKCSRLSPEDSNTEVSDGRRIDGKVIKIKEDPDNLGEKMLNECFIVVDRRK